MGSEGYVKVPIEQYEEVTVGRGELVDWLNLNETREALQFTEDAQPALVSTVTLQGYGNLNEDEVEQVGRDPFLISYGLVAPADRTIVTFEVSSPAKQRANRKIPDVCDGFGIPWCTLFSMLVRLDFTTEWHI